MGQRFARFARRDGRGCGFGCRFIGAVLVVLLQLPGRAAHAAETVYLLLFGDSFVAGYGLSPASAFPAQLQQALAGEGLRVKMIDAGVSGDTTAGARARLKWSLGEVEGKKPDAAIIELGGNDALQDVDPTLTAANLDGILSQLRKHNIPVLLTGMRAPPDMDADYARRFDAIYAHLAKKHRVMFYPLFLDGVDGNPALFQSDGEHPNAEGVAEIVKRMTPDVVALVRSVEQHATH